jgi:hypothetical protein
LAALLAGRSSSDPDHSRGLGFVVTTKPVGDVLRDGDVVELVPEP